MYLTLPIPVDKKLEFIIHFVPWDASNLLIKVRVSSYEKSSLCHIFMADSS